MDIKPIPTLSEEVNDIRTRTANIVAEHIIPMKKTFIREGINLNLSERRLDRK